MWKGRAINNQTLIQPFLQMEKYLAMVASVATTKLLNTVRIMKWLILVTVVNKLNIELSSPSRIKIIKHKSKHFKKREYNFQITEIYFARNIFNDFESMILTKKIMNSKFFITNIHSRKKIDPKPWSFLLIRGRLFGISISFEGDSVGGQNKYGGQKENVIKIVDSF